MTLDELVARESIRHTSASYNMAGDRLRVDDFVAVFTEDGIFEIDTPGEHAVRNVGREVIRNWFLCWGRGAKDANPVHQAKFIRHHLSTCLTEITDPDTAKSRTYWTAYTDIGPDRPWRILHGHVPEDRRPVADCASQGAPRLERAE